MADSVAWVVRHDVPVLDCFRQSLADGRTVEATAAKLKRIADKMNATRRATGDECPIIIGHTDDAKEEWEQPAIVGYASDFYVGRLGPAPALLARHWKLYPESVVGHRPDGTPVRMTADEILRRFPRRSPEWHVKDDLLDPISLLGATSPMRHLGLVRCARTPGVPPMNDLAGFLGALKDLIKQYEGGDAAPADADADAVQMEGAAAAPSSTNTYMPGDDDDTLKMASAADKFRMERDQLHRRLAALEKQDDERKKALDAEIVKMRRRTREADLTKMELSEGLVFDLAEELDAVTPLDDPAYEAHLVRMRKRYQRMPVGPFVQTAPVREGGGKPAASKEQAARAAKLALASGKSYDECLLTAMNG